jgi:cell division GTPase FtsZ
MLVEADAALVAVAGGNDLRFDEVQGIQNQFQRLCEHAQLMTGAAVDPALEGRLVVTVIATKGGASTLANAGCGAHPPRPRRVPSRRLPMRQQPRSRPNVSNLKSPVHAAVQKPDPADASGQCLSRLRPI